MQKILAGLKGLECQMDDILVFGDTYEQHDQRLEAVLKCIEYNGVTLNNEKCEFFLICQGENPIPQATHR